MTRRAPDIAWVDVETSGLRPGFHEVIEIAVIVTTPDLRREMAHVHHRFPMRWPERAHPRALAMNGYDPALWADEAVRPADVLPDLAVLLTDRALGGHNVAFDRAFIAATFDVYGLPRPSWHYQMLDTASLGYPRVIDGTVQRASLPQLCKAEGVNLRGHHTACGDVRATLELARRLLGVSLARRAGRAA